MVEICEKYLSWYEKGFGCFKRPFRLENNVCIAEAISGTERCGESKFSDFCIFNSYSLTNVMRKNEYMEAWLSEAEQETLPTAEFIATMREYYKKLMTHNNALTSCLDVAFETACLFPNSNSSIYGEVKLTMIIDVTKHDIDNYIKLFTRRAYLMNYNMIDFTKSDIKPLTTNDNTSDCTYLEMWFEALYQKGVGISVSNYAYHVTTKNAAKKILAGGLTSRNTNLAGFKYPDRVYMFIDPEKAEAASDFYARRSKKRNKWYIDPDHLKKMPKAEIDKLVEQFKDFQAGNTAGGLVVDDRKFVILQIDLSKIGDVKLYRDYMMPFENEFIAAYSYKPIPAKAISCFKEITV